MRKRRNVSERENERERRSKRRKWFEGGHFSHYDLSTLFIPSFLETLMRIFCLCHFLNPFFLLTHLSFSLLSIPFSLFIHFVWIRRFEVSFLKKEEKSNNEMNEAKNGNERLDIYYELKKWKRNLWNTKKRGKKDGRKFETQWKKNTSKQ